MNVEVGTGDHNVLAQYLLAETEDKGLRAGQIATKFTASEISLCQHFTPWYAVHLGSYLCDTLQKEFLQSEFIFLKLMQF
jgi:hypothetical protein